MKKFDIELAKKGWPVITRDGHMARVICYNRISSGYGTLVALITQYSPLDEMTIVVGTDGRRDYSSEDHWDLFLTDSWEGHDENGNPIEDKTEKIVEHKSDSPTKDGRPDNLIRFENILELMYKIYEKKNHDYGNSFSQSVHSYGPIAGLTRIGDKFHRLESLILKGEQKVQDESINDTLIDMANYCVMLRMALEQ